MEHCHWNWCVWTRLVILADEKMLLQSWIPWNLSFHYKSFHEKRHQTMQWHHKARVNSHQRWKQKQFRICFHLWCELTSTMNVTAWQVSWNSCNVFWNTGFAIINNNRHDWSLFSLVQVIFSSVMWHVYTTIYIVKLKLMWFKSFLLVWLNE